MNKITLGDKVKDPITGVIGIAVARTEWLHGCARITVQPKGTNKDGKLIGSPSFDEPQLEVVSPKKVKRGRKDTGGPRVEPQLKPSITK